MVDVARASLETAAYGRSTRLRLVVTEVLAMHVSHPEEAGAVSKDKLGCVQWNKLAKVNGRIQGTWHRPDMA